MMASRTLEVEVKVADIPEVRDALLNAADLIEAQRRLIVEMWADFDHETVERWRTYLLNRLDPEAILLATIIEAHDRATA
ncbi:MAG: hypothetical protein KC613_08770 [Myxococcales bacterium]|nr:hypothetical protein [Myxococcales bacterium]